MGKTKEYFQDLRAVCVMPSELYEELKHFKAIFKVSEYDNNIREYCKSNDEWQEFYEAEKLARNNKKKVEDDTEFEMLQNK